MHTCRYLLLRVVTSAVQAARVTCAGYGQQVRKESGSRDMAAQGRKAEVGKDMHHGGANSACWRCSTQQAQAKLTDTWQVTPLLDSLKITSCRKM